GGGVSELGVGHGFTDGRALGRVAGVRRIAAAPRRRRADTIGLGLAALFARRRGQSRMWTMQPPGKATPSDGTQSIERAITVLRMLATRGRVGWGLTDLASASGLKKATTH